MRFLLSLPVRDEPGSRWVYNTGSVHLLSGLLRNATGLFTHEFAEKVQMNNLPDIRDVNYLIELLKELGVKVKKLSPSSYEFQADEINLEYLQTDQCCLFWSRSSRYLRCLCR